MLPYHQYYLNLNHLFVYDKLDYLGFTPKKIDSKVDMSFREKTICFCGNFTLFHNEGNKQSFLKLLQKLNG